MIDEARELYAVPPADFVARRNALVRELKAEGRTDDAKSVGALRRPRLSEYALNAAVREDDALGQRFASAVADATAAQSAAIGGGGAEAMRTATRELRSATTALIETAVRQVVQLGAGGDQWDEIEQLLRSLANRPGVELLRAGLVGSTVVDPDDLFAGAPEPPDRPGPAARAPTKANTPARKVATSPPAKEAASPKRTSDARAARAEAARRRQLEAERSRARTALRSAEREASAARDVLDAATRAQAKAERRLGEAHASLDAAKAALQVLDEALAERRSTD